MRELSAKYETRAEIRLTSAAALRVPRVELSVRLTGAARREIAFYYDILRDRLLELACERCAAALTAVCLCGCGSVLCDDCYGACRCGRGVCPDCAAGSCHICGALLCAGCALPCSLPTATYSDVQVCAHCREEACATCRQLVGGSTW